MQKPLSEGAFYIYIYILYNLIRMNWLTQKENEILYSQKRETPMHYINDGNAFL